MFMGRARPKNYLRRTLMVAGALGILAYLAASAVEGERGLLASADLRRENALKADELVRAEAERVYLEKRVRALDPKALDLDMLEEQARRVLFYSDDGEILVAPPKVPPLRR
ncbi:MAG: septum formation initiator family protein [Alphaproteobacteria bacterium]